jgi:cysteine-rich repeat protein
VGGRFTNAGGVACNNIARWDGSAFSSLAGGTSFPASSIVAAHDQCNGAGACAHPNNTAPCTDGLYCNGVDTCAGGTCTHAGDPCAGGPQCADNCNELADSCNDPDGTSCDDGASCTIDDQCTAGTCAGDSMTCGDGTVQAGCNEDCDDGGLVTDDGCDPSCRFEPCKPAPDDTCKEPFVHAKASVKLKNDDDNTKDALQWKWNNGSDTDKDEFGDPLTTDDYWLCIYDAGALVSTTRVPFGGTCDGKPCWSDKSKGFKFKAKTPTTDGATGVSLGAGDDGKAKAQFKGKGGGLDLPAAEMTGPVIVQLVKSSGGACWSATYSAPFDKNTGAAFQDRAD